MKRAWVPFVYTFLCLVPSAVITGLVHHLTGSEEIASLVFIVLAVASGVGLLLLMRTKPKSQVQVASSEPSLKDIAARFDRPGPER